MHHDDFFNPPPKARRKRHLNVNISAESAERLEVLKGINNEKAIEEVRRAVEAEIDRRWRLLCKISGQDPTASPGSSSVIPGAPQIAKAP